MSLGFFITQEKIMNIILHKKEQTYSGDLSSTCLLFFSYLQPFRCYLGITAPTSRAENRVTYVSCRSQRVIINSNNVFTCILQPLLSGFGTNAFDPATSETHDNVDNVVQFKPHSAVNTPFVKVLGKFC